MPKTDIVFETNKTSNVITFKHLALKHVASRVLDTNGINKRRRVTKRREVLCWAWEDTC